MIDKRLVCAKLAQLRERQQLLTQLAAEPQAQFVADRVKISAAERALQVSIEICLDLGQHLIAALALPRPSEYRDIFRILGEHGLIDRQFADRLQRMAAFRNRLVHAYANVDPGTVYGFLQGDRADFDEFARTVASLVVTRGTEGET